MIYTSYFSRVKDLKAAGIQPIAISQGVPAGWAYRRIKELAPTWAMLKMSDADYNRCYEEILAKADRDEIVRSFEGMDVALLCWEKDINECHRKRVAEWLREGGYEVEEFQPEEMKKKKEGKKNEENPVITRQVSVWEILSML